MLSELGERFPHVVLDAPPVLGIADTLVLGNQVGAVLFVVAAAGTRKAHAKAALKRLRQAGVVPLGAVMTKLDLRDGMYGYESAYYYYQSTPMCRSSRDPRRRIGRAGSRRASSGRDPRRQPWLTSLPRIALRSCCFWYPREALALSRGRAPSRCPAPRFRGRS